MSTAATTNAATVVIMAAFVYLVFFECTQMKLALCVARCTSSYAVRLLCTHQRLVLSLHVLLNLR